MDKQVKTELRKLLTGRTVRNEEGWLVAVPDGSYLVFHGVTDRTIQNMKKRIRVRL